jgi:hypothetical protein
MVRATSQEQTVALEEERKDKGSRYYEFEYQLMEQKICKMLKAQATFGQGFVDFRRWGPLEIKVVDHAARPGFFRPLQKLACSSMPLLVSFTGASTHNAATCPAQN